MALPYNFYTPNFAQQTYPQNQYTNNLVHVPNENVARNYPVAPGNSVTFINDNAPFCYIKTVGYMPTDAPDFRIYKRFEDMPSDTPTVPTEARKDEAPVSTGNELKAEIEALRSRIEALESKSKPATRKEIEK